MNRQGDNILLTDGNFLKEGMVFKNYKELCLNLGEDIKNGKGKTLQQNNWTNSFEYIKQGHKIEIINIKTESEYNETIKSKGRYIQHDNYNVDKQYNKSNGVYSIKLNNQIYIGSTTVGFRRRFIQHMDLKRNDTASKPLIEQGGVFEILWIADEDCNEFLIRKKEQEYINYFKNETDLEVVNGYEYVSGFRKFYVVKKPKQIKPKTKTIKVKEEDYETLIGLAKENNITIIQ